MGFEDNRSFQAGVKERTWTQNADPQTLNPKTPRPSTVKILKPYTLSCLNKPPTPQTLKLLRLQYPQSRTPEAAEKPPEIPGTPKPLHRWP